MEGKKAKKGTVLKRSREFSSDPIFDPATLFEVIERDESDTNVRAAMRAFLERGESGLFEEGVALYVRCARARGDTIEQVLATLEVLADDTEGMAREGYAERDTPLRQHALRGVLLAFYGAEAVNRESAARESRTRLNKSFDGDGSPSA